MKNGEIKVCIIKGGAYINHPKSDSVGGIWGTGYASFEDSYFIFANLGTAGRMDHDYLNLLINKSLYWYNKGSDSIYIPTLKQMMSGKIEIYIFTEDNSSNVNFVFQGFGYVKDYENSKPAHVVWGLTEDLSSLLEKFRVEKRKQFIEGLE